MAITVIFYMVLILPGVSPPVKMDKQSANLEECIDDVRYILERANPEWPNGTRLQAGCVVIPNDKVDVR